MESNVVNMCGAKPFPSVNVLKYCLISWHSKGNFPTFACYRDFLVVNLEDKSALRAILQNCLTCRKFCEIIIMTSMVTVMMTTTIIIMINIVNLWKNPFTLNLVRINTITIKVNCTPHISIRFTSIFPLNF